MSLPPTADSTRTALERLSWTDVAASYALAPVLAVLVWAASAPLAAAASALVLATAVVLGRRARRLARCVEQCRALAYDLPGGVQVAVSWGDGPCRTTG
ncbi:hypothetical protein [Halobacterium yunchengense]|uniref:hypothetical protein n=1 Tax=Halobacterium yunchengense TaxID=3108497 RepID=UPI00300A53EB